MAGVWGYSPQPLDAIGGLGAKPQPPVAVGKAPSLVWRQGGLGFAPSAGRFFAISQLQ